MQKCKRCEGLGYVWIIVGKAPHKDMCPACDGKGYFPDDEAEEEADYEYQENIKTRTEPFKDLEKDCKI